MKKALVVILTVFLASELYIRAGAVWNCSRGKDTNGKSGCLSKKANGKDKAFEAFNNKKGAFVNKDLYIFVLGLNGKIPSHGANEKLIGKDMMATKDKMDNFS